MINYTYMLKCSDGSLYTGWTSNLEKRLEAHKKGRGSRYTRARLPIELVYFEVFDDKKKAMSREYQIKQMNRENKLQLLNSYHKNS